MKILNKLLLLLVIIMVNNCFLKGQSGNGTQLQYTYDANGNRLTRTVITVTMVSKTSVTDTLQSKKNVPINSAATDFKINVGPNPTTSLVTVSLQNTDLKQKEEFEYVVTSVTGAQVLTNKVQTSNTDIDLGGLKDGVYILKLMANNKTFIYKIVKAN